MSSYGSMSPSDESFERYEPPLFCHPPGHQGSPMSGVIWQNNSDTLDYDSQDVYHENHYISRNYGYEEIAINGNDPYDGFHQNIHSGYGQTSIGLDCDIQSTIPLRPYDRPTTQTFVRVVKRRNTANKKERRRTQSINTAFSDLRDCIPNVPADTKLSKIKTLRLATSYISYLMKVLESDEPAGGFRAELHHTPPRRQRNADSSLQNSHTHQSSIEKRGKGRTGWPQHVWALELKNEQNLQT